MVPEPRSAYALQFFFVSALLLAVAAALSFVMLELFPPDMTIRSNHFSPVFGISTCLLLIGSGFLFLAVESVRRERQKPFRRWLIFALGIGVLFVATQTYALTCLIRQQKHEDDSSSAAAFVAVCAMMHAMHFIIALLFLSHVTVQALADRYDHEYYWGVTVMAWFWHCLGIIWLAILVVMGIARFYG